MPVIWLFHILDLQQPHALKLRDMKSSPIPSSGSYGLMWFHTLKLAKNQVFVCNAMVNLPLHSICK